MVLACERIFSRTSLDARPWNLPTFSKVNLKYAKHTFPVGQARCSFHLPHSYILQILLARGNGASTHVEPWAHACSWHDLEHQLCYPCSGDSSNREPCFPFPAIVGIGYLRHVFMFNRNKKKHGTIMKKCQVNKNACIVTRVLLMVEETRIPSENTE